MPSPIDKENLLIQLQLSQLVTFHTKISSLPENLFLFYSTWKMFDGKSDKLEICSIKCRRKSYFKLKSKKKSFEIMYQDNEIVTIENLRERIKRKMIKSLRRTIKKS